MSGVSVPVMYRQSVHLRDVTTPKRYFEVIVDLMERMPEDSKPDYTFFYPI